MPTPQPSLQHRPLALSSAIGLIGSLGSLCVVASEPVEHHRDGHEQHATHGQHHSNAHHGSHLSALAGTTYHGDEKAATYGIDYEYRFDDLIGIGIVAEHAVAPLDATTVLAVADIHLWRELALQTGPGAELLQEATQGTGSDTRFVYRVGLLYEFSFGRTTLSPQLHYDLVPGNMQDSVVAALAFGMGF